MRGLTEELGVYGKSSLQGCFLPAGSLMGSGGCSKRLFSLFGGHLKEGKPSTGGISTRQQSIHEPLPTGERDLQGQGKVWRRCHTERAYGWASKGACFSGSGGHNGRSPPSSSNAAIGLLSGEAHTKGKGCGVSADGRSRMDDRVGAWQELSAL